MKIIVDCCGNDLGAKVAVEGAVKVVNAYDDTDIILCGDEKELKSLLSSYKYDESRIEIVNATEVITNDDVPTEAVRKKTKSSLVKAFDILRTNEDVKGLVSCGSTGALLTAAFTKVGRIKGVSRPALCAIIPTKNGRKVMLIDSGANVDCKPINICHFAIMASIYSKEFLGKENPSVALLNIGTEDKKGNEFSKECFMALKKTPVNFVGNMEARDLLTGKYDIVVADGFYGNILLKSIEGAAIFILSTLKKIIKKSFWRKVGVVFMWRAFKELKNELNYKKQGGALFIGVKKIVLKGHGTADASTFEQCILQVRTLAKRNLCLKIEEELKLLGDKLNG